MPMPIDDGRDRRTTHLLLQPRQHCTQGFAGQADGLACGDEEGRGSVVRNG